MPYSAIKSKVFSLRKVMIRLSANFFVPAAGVLFFLGSCQKPDKLGLDIQPESDLLNAVYSDTTTLITHTVLDDSLSTKGASASLLGSYNDPFFGKVSASFYTQVNITTTNINFGSPANLVCDSVDRKSTRLNSSHIQKSRMPSSA